MLACSSVIFLWTTSQSRLPWGGTMQHKFRCSGYTCTEHPGLGVEQSNLQDIMFKMTDACGWTCSACCHLWIRLIFSFSYNKKYCLTLFVANAQVQKHLPTFFFYSINLLMLQVDVWHRVKILCSFILWPFWYNKWWACASWHLCWVILFSVQDKLGVREVPFYALEKPGSKSIIPLAILFSCLSCFHPLRYFSTQCG